jgi:hypothetical protein
MATVNKDFKIKSGLVVEGTTGTINGYDILTESQASQDFIVSIVGGETLVKSVGTNLSVDGAGELSLDLVGIVEDIAGTRLTTDGSTLNVDVDGIADDLTGSYDFATNSDVTFAVGGEATLRGLAIAAAVTDLESYADQAELDAVSTANSYTNDRETAITTAYQSYADTAEQDAKDYADDLINDASSSSTEVWSAYKTGTEISLVQTAVEDALTDANTYTDGKIADIVSGAPELLDTLNELAAAINDDASFASTIGTSIGEKVAKSGDTMTGALTLSGAPTSNLHAATKAYVDSAESNAISTASSDATTKANAAQAAAEATASADATTKANAAQTAAEATASADATTKANAAEAAAIAHADALDTDDIEEGATNLYFTDSRAKDSVAQLLTGATLTNITIDGTGAGLTITAENGVADSTTDDLEEGEDNLYFTDDRAQDALNGTTPNFEAVELGEISKNVAATTAVPVAGIATAYSWLKDNYRSAEFLVKVAYGDHTEISKVLLTLAVNDNIAITEYGIVGTNGSASSVSAVISGNDVQLQVTTVNNTSTVTVVGTLLA